jgi:hypothetical protein
MTSSTANANTRITTKSSSKKKNVTYEEKTHQQVANNDNINNNNNNTNKKPISSSNAASPSKSKFANKSRSLRSQQVKPLNSRTSVTNIVSVSKKTPSRLFQRSLTTKRGSTFPVHVRGVPPPEKKNTFKNYPKRKGKKAVFNKGAAKGIHNTKDNLNLAAYRYSERAVCLGNATSSELDCIEVTMKRNGMEVTLVSSPKEDENDINDTNESPLHQAQGAVAMAMDDVVDNNYHCHTTTAHFARMSSRYHPLCEFKGQGQHRITTSTNHPISNSFKEKLAMLKSHLVSDEEQTARKEYSNIWTEMKAIEQDREVLKHQNQDEPHVKQCKNACSNPRCKESWDVNSYLNGVHMKRGGKKKGLNRVVDKEQLRHLQQSRGAFVHVGFRRKDVLPKFAAKCGGNPNSCQPHKIVQECNLELFGIDLISSSATTVRHLAIVTGEKGASFFISKDDGRAHCDSIHARLEERLKKLKKSHQQSSASYGAIRYLSCGPNRSYFAELVSGQTLWGIGDHDEEFQKIMDAFNVHRVAFGSFDHDTSWIVLSKDGRMAWRNLPSRLHQLLQSRGTNRVRVRRQCFLPFILVRSAAQIPRVLHFNFT